MSTIEEVKQRLDIVEVVSRYVPLTKAGRNFKALCPFHSEKTPSFFVFPERQTWRCFGACNTGGDAFSFVMKKEGLTFGETLRFLADRVGVLMPSKIELAPGRDEKERLSQANEVAAQFYHNLLVTSAQGERAREYLAGRGLNAKTISDFQLGFSLSSWESLKQYLLERGFTETELLSAGLIIQSEDGTTHDRFRNRLMFPIHDQRGHTTGFGGRVLDDSMPKYLNSPQTPVFDKSDSVYGIDLAAAAIRRDDLVVIVEGYMDVIIAHQYGFGNVVASMGIAITDKQVNKLKKLTKNLVLALDPDEAGEEAMTRCIDYESILGAEIRMIVLPGGKDPDEVIRENTGTWRELVEKSAPVIEFTMDKAVARLDMTTARDKSLAANYLLPLIARVHDDIRRDHYLTKLSRLCGISYNKLEGVLQGYLSKPATLKPKAPPVISPRLTIVSTTREDYCLTLLLRYPELKNMDVGLLPDYFQNTENREILRLWLETADLVSLRERLDPVVRDKLDNLTIRQIPGNRLGDKFHHCVLLLQRDYLQNQEVMRKEIFSQEQEAETSGYKAALERLQKEGEPGKKFQENDTQRAEITRRARK